MSLSPFSRLSLCAAAFGALAITAFALAPSRAAEDAVVIPVPAADLPASDGTQTVVVAGGCYLYLLSSLPQLDGRIVVRGLAGARGQLVIAYDREWRRLWTRRFADPLADAETFRINAAGQLLEIGGKTTRIEDIEGQYMGLLKFTPAAWNAVETLLGTLDAPTRNRLDMTGLLRRLLAEKNLPISTFATDGQWGEIDNPEDVALYQTMIQEGELVLDDVLPGRETRLR